MCSSCVQVVYKLLPILLFTFRQDSVGNNFLPYYFLNAVINNIMWRAIGEVFKQLLNKWNKFICCFVAHFVCIGIEGSYISVHVTYINMLTFHVRLNNVFEHDLIMANSPQLAILRLWCGKINICKKRKITSTKDVKKSLHFQ